jgi:hypothetical protein
MLMRRLEPNTFDITIGGSTAAIASSPVAFEVW